MGNRIPSAIGIGVRKLTAMCAIDWSEQGSKVKVQMGQPSVFPVLPLEPVRLSSDDTDHRILTSAPCSASCEKRWCKFSWHEPSAGLAPPQVVRRETSRSPERSRPVLQSRSCRRA